MGLEPSHLADDAPLGVRDRLNREPGDPDQRHAGQALVGLDPIEADRGRQLLHRGHVDRLPGGRPRLALAARDLIPIPAQRDFTTYYLAAQAQAQGLSPYDQAALNRLAAEQGRLQTYAYIYPPIFAALLRPHAERQGFRLELALDPDLPPVRCERDALAQILFNLVENALKYARSAGGRSIRIACARERGRVALSVRDHGPGVPERRLARIFEPFYRGEDELTRETRGSGIGLALVEGLAERMGASVSAHNPEGGGLEITLSFPPAA